MARRPWRTIGVWLSVWTLVALFFASQTALGLAYAEQSVPWGRLVASAMADWYLWALLAPAILRLARLVPFTRARWPLALGVHLPASAVFVLAKSIVRYAIGQGVPWLAIDPSAALTVQFHLNVVAYWAILGAGATIGYYRKYREQQLAASRLEARLATMRLEALKAQLHPHFLFNTLNAIAALVPADPDGAQEMIAELSDLLRLSLASTGVQEVSLRQEAEFLEGYLAIQRRRFGHRLATRVDIDPRALDARVPNLLLQPLVENAIAHGIATRAAGGRLEVHAARRDGTLILRVSDDGPGLPPDWDAHGATGVGLANTRARLAQLYGPAHAFVLRNRPEGGLDVTITLPFHADPNADRR